MAWIRTLNLVAVLKMVISVTKSWLWSVNIRDKKDLLAVNLLFPSGDVEVPVLQHAKDLGEIVQYTKGCFSRPLLERIEGASTRMAKLKNIPLSVHAKAN